MKESYPLSIGKGIVPITNARNEQGIMIFLERRACMKVIFEEYSGIIITAFAIIALITVVGLLLASNGPVHTAFTDLIDTLFQKASVS